MGLEFRPAVVRAADGLDAGQQDLFFVVQDLGQDVSLLAAVEHHLDIGGHGHLEEGVPAHLVGLLVRHDAALRVVHAQQGEQRKDGGVVAEPQVCGHVGVVFQGNVGLLDKVFQQRADRIADYVAVLGRSAPHPVDGVVAVGPQVGDLFRREIRAEDFYAQEVDELAQAAGGEDGPHEGLGVAHGFEGGAQVGEQRGQEAGEVIAGLSREGMEAPGLLLAGTRESAGGEGGTGRVSGARNVQAGVDVGHETLCAGKAHLQMGAFLLERIGEVVHAHDAAEAGAGEALDLLPLFVLEDIGETLRHAGGQRAVLLGAAGRQGAFHALVGIYYAFHLVPKLFSGLGEQVQGVQVGESLLGPAGEGGVLLIAGTVASVMGDVKGFVALGCRRVPDGIELIGVHVVGRPVRVLGEQAHGLFLLGAQAHAEGQEQGGQKKSFHICHYVLVPGFAQR